MDGLHQRGAWMLKRQQVFTDAIRVKVDGITVPYRYDRNTDMITVAIEKPLPNGVHFVETELVNLLWKPQFAFTTVVQSRTRQR